MDGNDADPPDKDTDSVPVVQTPTASGAVAETDMLSGDKDDEAVQEKGEAKEEKEGEDDNLDLGEDDSDQKAEETSSQVEVEEKTSDQDEGETRSKEEEPTLLEGQGKQEDGEEDNKCEEHIGDECKDKECTRKVTGFNCEDTGEVESEVTDDRRAEREATVEDDVVVGKRKTNGEEENMDQSLEENEQTTEPLKVVDVESIPDHPASDEGTKEDGMEVEEEEEKDEEGEKDPLPTTSGEATQARATHIIITEDISDSSDTELVSTLYVAKDKIRVLRQRLERERTLRCSLEKHNAALIKQVERLSQEVHNLRRAGAVSQPTYAVGVQTESDCIDIPDENQTNHHRQQYQQQQAEVFHVSDGSSTTASSAQRLSGAAGSKDWTSRTQGQTSSSTGHSVADSVRATAEAALAHSGVVLDEASGMYYDYNSGYYYDPNNHLYYDPARGIYYYYDDNSQSYQYHSKVNMPEVVVTTTGANRHPSSEGRRPERDRRKGDRSKRMRNYDEHVQDESGNSRRHRASNSAAASATTADMDCEVIDITSPTEEDVPENGTSSAVNSRDRERNGERGEGRGSNNEVVEIIDEEDSTSRRHYRHRHRSRSSSSRSRRRKIRRRERCREEEREREREKEKEKENGQEDDEEDELPDVIVIESDDSEMEEGELSDSPSESAESSPEDSEDEASEESEESMVIDDDDDVLSVEATKVDYPPCVRMIVVRSESMKLGDLSVVTCTGGTIGREGSSHIMLVPELGVSKTHAQVAYDKENAIYTITDLGSQNGTVLNGVPLTQKSRMKSDPQLLRHKDYLTFGTTTLRIHIHQGGDTCDECEPGQVQALFRQRKSMDAGNTQSQADKEQQRRRELNRMKKKYMISGAHRGGGDPSRGSASAGAGYKDRAEERRATVGSDNPYQPNDMPASVDRAISDQNVGHKMLRKMGWKEGESLGKTDAGIKEPIQVFLRGKKSGLGAGGQKSMDSMGYLGIRKSEVWDQARDRFYQLEKQGGASSRKQGQQSQQSLPHQASSSKQGSHSQMSWVKGGTQRDQTQDPALAISQGSVDNSRKGAERDVEEICDVDTMEDGSGEGGERTSKGSRNQENDASALDAGGGRGGGDEENKEAATSPSRLLKDNHAADVGSSKAAVLEDDASGGEPSNASNSVAAGGRERSLKGTGTKSSSSKDVILHGLLDESKDTPNSKSDPQPVSSKLESNPKPGEREAAKKPIKFVIPPRMNTRSEAGKAPLTASRTSPSHGTEGGENTASRRTRQSSRRNKEGKDDKIDMFENG